MPAQRVALDDGTAITEPRGRGAQPLAVRRTADRLVPAPVERQRDRVEELEPALLESAGGLELRSSHLAVGVGDELEPDAPELEGVSQLGHSYRLPSEWLPVGAEYEIRNAQNWHKGPVARGVYDGKPVRLPMVGMDPVQPIGAEGYITREEMTGKGFNVFVLEAWTPGSRTERK